MLMLRRRHRLLLIICVIADAIFIFHHEMPPLITLRYAFSRRFRCLVAIRFACCFYVTFLAIGYA